MSDAETRALGRAAALLLVASLARWGWGAVRSPGEVPPGPDRTAELIEDSRVLASDQRARERPLEPSERLDPNRAPEPELDRLPGLGAATARAIVASRERDGAFLRAEDLTRVRGIGPATLDRMRPHLDFSSPPPATLGARGRGEGPPPAAIRSVPASPGGAGATRSTSLPAVDVNRADAAALEQLPGIGPALARRILEARAERPFDGPEDLLRVRGIGPATLEKLRPRIRVRR